MSTSSRPLESHLQALADSVDGLHLHVNLSLAFCGTFRLGGPCRLLLDCQRYDAFVAAVTALYERNEPFLLIGSGSNILFSDEGWPGVLVRYDNVVLDAREVEPGVLEVSAGCNLDALVSYAIESEWTGLEAFSGIPGTIGGAVVGNAGAWGVQMEHVLTRVEGFTAAGERFSIDPEACGFRYRHSRLKDDGDVVSRVRLQVTRGDKGALRAERRRILDLRAEKHPDLATTPCIGSFFKNLEPSSAAERRQAAGWFLEQAGAKQMSEGGAEVFHKHGNILIKGTSRCSADDVAALARDLQDKVEARFGFRLQREVRYLGVIEGEDAGKGFY